MQSVLPERYHEAITTTTTTTTTTTSKDEENDNVEWEGKISFQRKFSENSYFQNFIEKFKIIEIYGKFRKIILNNFIDVSESTSMGEGLFTVVEDGEDMEENYGNFTEFSTENMKEEKEEVEQKDITM